MSNTNKFNIDIDAIRELAKLLEETGLSEIEYAEGDRKLRCVAQGRQTVQQVVAAAAAPPAIAATPAAQTAAAPSPGTTVPSPMVGTVYLSSSPGGAPFVKAGDKVKQGDTLLIIEAMKVMNPIKAPKGGTIAQILVEDAKPVEFGETLVVIE
jgi:acetyl-CoA carboxylase biotin carboxyl carrier protein